MIRHFTTLSMLGLLAGCADQAPQAAKPAFDSSRNPDMLAPDLYPGGAVPEKEPVVRYGRYTLVSTLPEAGQRDLMSQIIDVSIPPSMKPNVRDAMQYVMNRSGYVLCPASTGHVSILYTRPLPVAQYKLGPVSLRNALQVLAGPAWQVKVDEVNRQVCYVLRPGYQLPDATGSESNETQLVDRAKPAHIALSANATESKSGVVVTPVSAQASITAGSTSLPSAASTASKTDLTSVAPVMHEAAAPEVQHAKATTPGPTPIPKPLKTVVRPLQPAEVATPIALQANKPAITPVLQVKTWSASTGSTLRQTVEGWAAEAGWKLIWKADDLDYPIEAPLSFQGSFETAIEQLFPLYDAAPRSFVVDGSPPQRVVYIAERKP